MPENLHEAAASGAAYWIAVTIFLVAFAAIVSERVHKTKVALFGAALMIVLSIVEQDDAFHSSHLGVDWNVIFLLISMMILVNVLAGTGVFEWAAIRAAKLARGRPMGIMSLFVILTAVASAFLDNVTTVLLLAPVTLLVCDELDLDPVPFVLAEALSSNIGGTATLIGDPPNIMVASRAKLSFLDFLVHLAPVVLVMMVAFLIVLRVLYGSRLEVDEAKRQRILSMDESKMVKDPVLARKALVVLGLTLVGFVLHGFLHLEPATIALLGASVVLLVARGDPHKALSEIEWNTLFFFIGLFIIVGGIVKVGAIRDVSELLIRYTEPSRDSMEGTAYALLWGSAVLSAIVDNIPYVATMSPLVMDMANTVFHGGGADPAALPIETLHEPVLMPVWWSLALGACLGGNGTAIGASANVVVLGIASRSGVKISFVRFLAFGAPVMFLTVAIAHVYVKLRYY
jgi:Na+/H+ antiporter NhaD/arsenite permease-like protein